MLLAHLIACTGRSEAMSLEDSYAFLCSCIQEERIRYIYQCGAKHIHFEEALAIHCAIFEICSFIEKSNKQGCNNYDVFKNAISGYLDFILG